jgi:hypothetical protein
MSGYKTYQRMQDLEANCNKLGFMLEGHGRHGYGFPGNEDIFFIRVPQDDGSTLPVYTRGIELFAGDLTQCESFVRGWQKHQEYLQALGMKNKITAAERKTADHYKGERLKRAIVDGRDPGYSGVLPDGQHNAPF